MSLIPSRVELIYDAGCPNVAAARAVLIRAFARAGIPARWREWERGVPGSPRYAQDYGSPTILVNGKDVADEAPGAGNASCRIYRDGEGRLSRTPSLEDVCAALRNGLTGSALKARVRAVGASLPAVGLAALPKLTCPLCFPAYTAALGALGLEFVDYTPYLLPLTVVFLAVALAVLANQSRRTGIRYPLLLGIAASAVVLFGKFQLESDWLTTGGIVLLIVAVFFGSRAKPASSVSCPACAPGEGGQRI